MFTEVQTPGPWPWDWRISQGKKTRQLGKGSLPWICVQTVMKICWNQTCNHHVAGPLCWELVSGGHWCCSTREGSRGPRGGPPPSDNGYGWEERGPVPPGRQVVSDGAEASQAQPPLQTLTLRSDRSVSPDTADQVGRGWHLHSTPRGQSRP